MTVSAWRWINVVSHWILVAMTLVSLLLLSLFAWKAWLDYWVTGISIPSDMNVSEPYPYGSAPWGVQKDDEATVIRSLSDDTKLKDGRIENVALPKFSGKARDLLLRHLASSCKWKVGEENGKIFAHRREVNECGNWDSSPGGSISLPFISRTTIAMDTPEYLGELATIFHVVKTTDVPAEPGAVQLDLSSEYSQYRSSLCDRFGSASLEIKETSSIPERKFTQGELYFVKAELDYLMKSPIAASRGFDPSIMPTMSIRHGQPEMRVRNQPQGGNYCVDAFVNPGESGKCSLKVFEATRNTRLSEAGISKYSLEYVGWSDDPSETFFFNCMIFMDEGNWSTFYPARFELWFEPSDKAKPQRKLLEKVYRICGWEH